MIYKLQNLELRSGDQPHDEIIDLKKFCYLS